MTVITSKSFAATVNPVVEGNATALQASGSVPVGRTFTDVLYQRAETLAYLKEGWFDFTGMSGTDTQIANQAAFGMGGFMTASEPYTVWGDTGIVGGAFKGGVAYAEYASGPVFSSVPFSLCFWMRVDRTDYASLPTFIGQYTAAIANGGLFNINATSGTENPMIGVTFRGASGSATMYGPELSHSTWYHIGVVARSEGWFELYANAALVSSWIGPDLGFIFESTDRFKICRGLYGVSPEVTIADLRIWREPIAAYNGAIPASLITAIYNEGAGTVADLDGDHDGWAEYTADGSRVTLTGVPVAPTTSLNASLNISEAVEDDEGDWRALGFYQGQYGDDGGSDGWVYEVIGEETLTVNAAPSETLIIYPSKNPVISGRTAYIYSSGGASNYEWTKDGAAYVSGSATLTFNPAIADYTGLYQLSADSPLGTPLVSTQLAFYVLQAAPSGTTADPWDSYETIFANGRVAETSIVDTVPARANTFNCVATSWAVGDHVFISHFTDDVVSYLGEITAAYSGGIVTQYGVPQSYGMGAKIWVAEELINLGPGRESPAHIEDSGTVRVSTLDGKLKTVRVRDASKIVSFVYRIMDTSKRKSIMDFLKSDDGAKYGLQDFAIVYYDWQDQDGYVMTGRLTSDWSNFSERIAGNTGFECQTLVIQQDGYPA